MKLALGAVLLALVAGCGGNSEPATPPTVGGTTLREACPAIEADLPNGELPTAAQWAAYKVSLASLRRLGDQETQNAIDVLTPSVESLAVNPRGTAFLDARSSLGAALDTLAARCKAVGSSALQRASSRARRCKLPGSCWSASPR